MPIDYKNGKIYKIVNNENNKIYYGSTTQPLHKRMYKHRSKHNDCMSKKLGVDLKECKIILVEKYPCECRYELEKRERFYIENNDCVNMVIPTRTRKEWYEVNKEKIKKYNKKWTENNKEKIKQHYEKNKDKIAEKGKEYYEKNKEKIAEKNKEYHKDNKQKINEKRKEYQQKNKDKIAERKKQHYKKNKEKTKQQYEKNKQLILEKAKQYYPKNKLKIAEKGKLKMTCECGSVFRKSDKARHLKSKKHKNFVNSNSSTC